MPRDSLSLVPTFAGWVYQVGEVLTELDKCKRVDIDTTVIWGMFNNNVPISVTGPDETVTVTGRFFYSVLALLAEIEEGKKPCKGLQAAIDGLSAW